MTRGLALAGDLTLPTTAVTEPIGIFANRGKGKSNAAHRIVEQLYYNGLPAVVLDIKGDWYGIRSSSDGTSEGLPFLIVGGEHGDVPLEPGSAAQWAAFLVEHMIPTIFDLSSFSKTAARRWVMEFAEELYQLKAKEQFRDPIMLVVDEADVLIPQRLAPELMRLLGAMEDIAKRGRQRGLGIIVISQRVADVNKSVTDLLETLLLFAITGTRTRKAILEWIDDHADRDEAKEVVATLSTLPPGKCWVWSPGWLKLLRLVTLHRIDTFDSHATPEPGRKRATIKTLADIDLTAVQEAFAQTIERAKEDDPTELRRRLQAATNVVDRLKADGWSDLDRVPSRDYVMSLEERVVELEGRPAELEVIRLPIISDADLDRLDTASRDIGIAVDALATAGDAIRRGAQDARELSAAGDVTASITSERPPPPRDIPDLTLQRAAPAQPARQVPADLAGVINEPRQKILDALAWYAQVGVKPVRRTHVAFVAGTSPKSSGFEKNLSTLRTAGLIDYPTPNMVALTDAGEPLAQAGAEVSTTAQLLNVLERQLGRPKGAVLRTLVGLYPKVISRQELAETLDVSHQSSGFEKNLSTLRTLGFVDYPQQGFVVATDLLFLRPSDRWNLIVDGECSPPSAQRSVSASARRARNRA